MGFAPAQGIGPTTLAELIDDKMVATATGDARGLYAVDLQLKRSADSQVASGDYSALLAGYASTASGDYSAAIAGRLNTVAGKHCVAIGGYSNTLDAATQGSNVIVGGQSNSTGNGTRNVVAGGILSNISNSSHGNFVGGGRNNDVATGCLYGGIVAGKNNDLSSGADYCFVGGGYTNDAIAHRAGIVGGQYHTINSGATDSFLGGGASTSISANADHCAGVGVLSGTLSGDHCFLGGGESNTAGTGTHAGVLAGQGSTASGQRSVVCGGYKATASGESALAAGHYATADAAHAVAAGYRATANAKTYAVAHGYRATAYHADALAMPRKVADAANEVVPGAVSTTDATITTILTVTPTDDRMGHLVATFVGWVAGGTKIGKFKREVAFKAVSGTASLVGSADTIGTDQNPDSWGGVTIDASGATIRLRVTGKVLTAIDWHVVTQLTWVG